MSARLRTLRQAGVRATTLLLAMPLFAFLAADTRSRRAHAADAPLQICLQALGPHDRQLLTVAGRGIRYLYGFTVRMLPAQPLPRAAYYKPRRRHRADKLITHLESIMREAPGCDRIIGFTGRDISTSVRGHRDWGIFGLATIGGPAGVVSTHRLRGRAAHTVVQRRTVKVVNHELGHTLGIPHVTGMGCLMQDAMGTIKTVDAESGLLCGSTRRRMQLLNDIELPAHDTFTWSRVIRP